MSAVPGITVTPVSTALTIDSPGGTATDGLTITSVGEYSGAAGLTCAVISSGRQSINDTPTCSLSTVVATFTPGTNATGTLTINTTAPQAQMRSGQQRALAVPIFGGWGTPLFVVLFACFRSLHCGAKH